MENNCGTEKAKSFKSCCIFFKSITDLSLHRKLEALFFKKR